MPRAYPRLTFTPSVQERQAHYGSRRSAAALERQAFDDTRLSFRESAFLAERDGFYLATVNEDGWPYLQFRGGPPGFLKVLDDRTLGYADFRGNRQYISMGNLRHDDRVALFFMDYPGRRRLKLMARSEVLEAADDPARLEQVALPNYRAQVERVVLFHVVAFDWNCPQHITPRWTHEEWMREQASVD